MPRKAVAIVALSLAFAVVTGTIALTKTVHLGQAAAKPAVSDRAIAKRTAQLNRFEAALLAQLGKKPPAVPKLPPAPAASSVPAVSAAASGPVSAAPQRVVYVRPAPIVVHKHRAGGEHEGRESNDHEGGSDD
jgi:hypothetical protein